MVADRGVLRTVTVAPAIASTHLVPHEAGDAVLGLRREVEVPCDAATILIEGEFGARSEVEEIARLQLVGSQLKESAIVACPIRSAFAHLSAVLEDLDRCVGDGFVSEGVRDSALHGLHRRGHVQDGQVIGQNRLVIRVLEPVGAGLVLETNASVRADLARVSDRCCCTA